MTNGRKIIKIVCVGRLTERYLQAAVDELSARINKKAVVNICEAADEKLPERLSGADAAGILAREGSGILKHISAADYAAALAIGGKMLTSDEFAELIRRQANPVFIIGGTLGLSGDVMRRSDTAISFSKMTFPHQLMRVILLEQIERAVNVRGI